MGEVFLKEGISRLQELLAELQALRLLQDAAEAGPGDPK